MAGVPIGVDSKRTSVLVFFGVGGSTGINVVAAVEVAKSLGPGHTIVTLLCDRGSLYFQRLFNPEWLREKGLFPA